MTKKPEENDAKKIGAEIILMGIIAPIIVGFVFWFGSFVVSSAKTEAKVDSQDQVLKEIRTDVKLLLQRR